MVKSWCEIGGGRSDALMAAAASTGRRQEHVSVNTAWFVFSSPRMTRWSEADTGTATIDFVRSIIQRRNAHHSAKSNFSA
jgi:hypothetical protein